MSGRFLKRREQEEDEDDDDNNEEEEEEEEEGEDDSGEDDEGSDEVVEDGDDVDDDDDSMDVLGPQVRASFFFSFLLFLFFERDSTHLFRSLPPCWIGSLPVPL
jgi:hypothetical protein